MTLSDLQLRIAAARTDNPQAAVELVDALLAASIAIGASDLRAQASLARPSADMRRDNAVLLQSDALASCRPIHPLDCE